MKYFLGFLLCVFCVNAFAQNNVGIGTTTPNASAVLDVNSTTSGLLPPRMTAIQRIAINPAVAAKGLLVFDTDSSAFMFWNGMVWAKIGTPPVAGNQWSGDGFNMHNTNSGNVGIGVTNPDFKLDIAGRMRIRNDGDANTSAGIWLNKNADNGSNAFIGNRDDSTVGFYGNEGANWGLMMNTRNGRVGIGVNRPNAPLQLSNAVQNRKIVLFEGANNDHQFYGFGINGSTLRYQTSGSGADHVFFSGINSTSSKELMRIKGDGNVGIGITDPVYQLDLGGRMRIRGAAGFTSGLWLNNEANTAIPAFIGMQANDQVGFFGSGTGWSLLMNTQTGAVSFGGNAGQPGQVLTSNGSTGAPTWQANGSPAIFIVKQSSPSTSTVSGQVDIPDLVANFTLAVASKVLFQYSADVTAESCFGCTDKRVSIILYQNVSGGINFLDRSAASIENGFTGFTTLVSGPAVFDFPPGTYSFKVMLSATRNTNTAVMLLPEHCP